MQRKKLDIIIGNTIKGFLLLVAVVAYFVLILKIEQEKKPVIQYVDRIKTETRCFMIEEINNIIIKEYDKNQSAIIHSIFNKLTHNQEITEYIIMYSLEHDIPVSLAFALAMTENRQFDPNAKRKNKDGSYDLGIYQLNTKTFKDYTENDLLIPSMNISLGLGLLIYDYKQYGTWTEAICRFHRGNTIDSKGLKYIDDVLNAEMEVIKLFNSECRGDK